MLIINIQIVIIRCAG